MGVKIDFLGFNNDTTVQEIKNILNNRGDEIQKIENYRKTEASIADTIFVPLIKYEPEFDIYVKEIGHWEDGDNSTINSGLLNRIYGGRIKDKLPEFHKKCHKEITNDSTLEDYWEWLNKYQYWGDSDEWKQKLDTAINKELNKSENQQKNPEDIRKNLEDIRKKYSPDILKEKILLELAPDSKKFITPVSVCGKNSSIVMNNTGDSLKHAKNIIFYGPPGTGKTRKAKILAYKILMNNKAKEDAKKTDDEILDEVKKIIQDNSRRIKIVQFHPSYSYNDFMESIEFSNGGCEYKNKIFKEFAEEARKALEEAKRNEIEAPAYVLIIDEINRANVSSVLGELLYGLEYREKEFSTAIKGEKFSVPENLYIIGTMNTADRSLQNLDYAVRRRFSFEKVSAEQPNAMESGKSDSDCYQVGENKYFYKAIFEQVKGDVEASVARGINAEDILPGISYFLVEGETDTGRKDHLTYKIEYELIPLLKEYAKDGMFTNRKKIVDGNSLIELLKNKEYKKKLLGE